jgi:hypothetical protein
MDNAYLHYTAGNNRNNGCYQQLALARADNGVERTKQQSWLHTNIISFPFYAFHNYSTLKQEK